MTKPLGSLITSKYKQAPVTCALLTSLRAVTYPAIEIIVVDNALPEAEVPPIAKLFPEVKLLRSAENPDFAGGNNLGIAVASGKYVLFLNNDTEVTPGFLEPLVELFETIPTAGVAAPKLIFYGQILLLGLLLLALVGWLPGLSALESLAY